MRLQLLSDLHLEHRFHGNDKALFDRLQPRPDDAIDLLVLAGDAVSWAERIRTADLLREVSTRWKDVLYVPGNHEYYGADMGKAEEVLADLSVPSNVEVVTAPRTVTYEGFKFHCGTMWYHHADVEATGCIDPSNGCFIGKHGRLVQFSDFRWIRNFTPYSAHTAFMKLLAEELCEGDVVVSHHLPTPECTPERFRGEVDNCFFVSDQTKLIQERRPRAWLHGHTHDDIDLSWALSGEMDTQILANPLGYPGEREKRGSHFDPHRAIVELQ